MKRDIILYSLSTALNKGAVLLFFPLLTQILSLEDFGLWSLIIVVSNLIIPILSLNGTASILREGSVSVSDGFSLLKGYAGLTVLISVFAYAIFWFLGVDDWILSAILISSGEALLFLTLTFLRAKEQALLYFIINFLKVFFLLVMLLVALNNIWSLEHILQWHIKIVMLMSFVVLLIEFFKSYRIPMLQSLDWKFSLLFGITLIPHSLFQWMMSSADRLIIKYQLGDTSLGSYSLAYSIALVLMLVNSGLALALPTYIIKNYKEWRAKNYDNVLIRIYSQASVVLFALILIAYYFDSKYFRVLGHYGFQVIIMTTLIYAGLYFLGLYYFYSNHLFYYKKSATISYVTFKVAIFSVLATIGMVYLLGIVGAALSTFLSYVLYLLLVRKESLKVDPDIKIGLIRPIVFSLVSFALISGMVGYASAV